MTILFWCATTRTGRSDTTFGTGGIQTTDLSGPTDRGYSVALQADGKIVLGGTTGFPSDIVVVRYNTDGSIDTSFGVLGVATAAIGSSTDRTEQIIVQPDGKILVAAYVSAAVGSDFGLVRFNSDGTADNTFGTDGVATFLTAGGFDYLETAALQADGKILLAGYSNTLGSDIVLLRVNADGTLDNTFDGDGQVITNFNGAASTDRAFGIAVQSDGRILLVGSTDEGESNVAVLRYNTNGSLDTTFSGDGLLAVDIGDADIARDIVIQSDGSIVLTGNTESGGNTDVFLIRVDSNGVLDAGFGTGGIATTSVDSGDDSGESVTITADGSIFVAGNAGADFVLLRYDPVGTISSNAELTIDTVAPVVSVDALVTNDTTPELTGLVDDVNASVSINVGGSDYVATNNGDGTWTLANDAVAALAEGIYNVTVSATDAAGNVGTEANPDELEIDLTLPVVSVDALVTNDTTPELTGLVDDVNATVSVNVDGNDYVATNNGNGTWTLANDAVAALAEGIYNVTVSATGRRRKRRYRSQS